MKFTLSLFTIAIFLMSSGLFGSAAITSTQQDENVMQNSHPNKVYFSWEDYLKKTSAVAKKIHESGWEFDQIVCIARGGMFLGDSLSRLFDKPLAVISASSYREEGGTNQDQLIISKHIAMTTKTLKKRILLVDDMVDSGITLEKIKTSIAEKYPEVEEIRTAVIWRKSHTHYEADYIAEEIDSKIWIVQPFEIYEEMDLKNL